MVTPRRRKNTVAANDVHPATLADTVVSDGFLSSKLSIFCSPDVGERKISPQVIEGKDYSYDDYDDYCYCSGY